MVSVFLCMTTLWATVLPTSPTPPSALSTREIFNRKVYDVAAHPKNSLFKIASAEGVFLKLPDSANWEKLSQFQNENHPVLITPTNTIMVGAMRSTDGGKTFSEYIPWDAVLSQVVAVTKRTHEHVKVIGLRRGQGNDLRVLLDGGANQHIEITLPALAQ
jgi:hypothetical protein